MTAYGSNANPVSLDPFQTIVGVGWPNRTTYLAFRFSLTTLLDYVSLPLCDPPYTALGSGESAASTYLQQVTYSYATGSVVTTYSSSPLLYRWRGNSGPWTTVGTASPAGMPAAGQVVPCTEWAVGNTNQGLLRWQGFGVDHASGLFVPGSSVRKFRSGISASVDQFGVPFTDGPVCYYPDPSETMPGLGTTGAPFTPVDLDTQPELLGPAGAVQEFNFSGATVTYNGETFSVVGVGSDGDFSPNLWLLLEKVTP